MKKRRPILLCLALLPPAYFLYYIEAGKPRALLREVIVLRDRRDLESARSCFADRLELQWRGSWCDTSDGALKGWLWWNHPPELLRTGAQLTQYIDWKDPLHRYVRSDETWGAMGFSHVRLRWTGFGWKIDGLSWQSCVVPEGYIEFLGRLVRIG